MQTQNYVATVTQRGSCGVKAFGWNLRIDIGVTTTATQRKQEHTKINE